ncbi:MAG: PleD family two-component system response regulator [Candidatus Zixiibacteriota bacterium]
MSEKALVVDDDYISRQVILNALSDKFSCDIAVRGEDAIEMFNRALSSKYPYKLVCLDIMMPGMYGHKVLKTMRKMEYLQKIPKEKSAKIIMISGMENTETKIMTLKYRADKYITKPVRKEKVIAILRSLKIAS